MKPDWKFNHTYSGLPDEFYVHIKPAPVSSPRLIKFNIELAGELGLTSDDLTPEDLAHIFSGNRLTEGMYPLAQAYAGHQFGHFTILGDGRAHLLGEVTGREGGLFDIQLKGSGITPFSRDGDGRAPLGPMLREYIVSEAMAALGIPTTRSLAVVSTGDTVFRETPLPGAILTRVARSHIRVGTFEFFAARQNFPAVKRLADYTIDRHYSHVKESESPYTAFFHEAVKLQAELISSWMLTGFIHGVMNTDNMSIAGETIDYGPCAFIDEYHPDTVFSSIDRMGRYRYSMQPSIARWNLTRLAETLVPLIIEAGTTEEKALQSLNDSLESFSRLYLKLKFEGMCLKLGLSVPADENSEEAEGLIQQWLDLLSSHRADYTNSHRALCDYTEAVINNEPDPAAALKTDEQPLFSKEDMKKFILSRDEFIKRKSSDIDTVSEMKRHNPVYIPRNHRIEAVIRKAEDENDFTLFEELLTVLRDPFTISIPEYMNPPEEHQRVRKTFCGT